MGIKYFPDGFARYHFINLKKTIGPSNYIRCDFCQELINENIFDEHMFEPDSSNYCLKARQHSSKSFPIFYTEYEKCSYCLKIINRPNLLQHMKDCKLRLRIKPENILRDLMICKHIDSNFETFRPNCSQCADRMTLIESRLYRMASNKYTQLQKFSEICMYTFGIDNSTSLENFLREIVVDITCRQFTFNLYKTIRYIKRRRKLPTFSEWSGLFPTYVYHIFLNLSDILFVEKPNVVPSLLNDPEFKALGNDWIVVKQMPSHIERPKFVDDGLYLNIGRFHHARNRSVDVDFTSNEKIEIQYFT